MSRFFDNFLGGMAFGMLANNPFFGGCFGFGMYGMYNRVDFGCFANPFPSVFGSGFYSSYSSAAMPMPTTFANSSFPSIDFTSVGQTIWDTYTNPDSDYNKAMREYYKNINSQSGNNSCNYQNFMQFTSPFSLFYPSVQNTRKPSGDKSTEKSSPESYISKYSNDKYFSKMLTFVLDHEGGYANLANDRGGPTNMGITQKTYDGFRKEKGLSSRSVKLLTREEADEFYHKNYIACGADKISNPKLAMCVFDWANHSGPNNDALKRALKECNGDVDKFITMRSDFLHRLIEKDPSQEDFRKGWDNRIKDLRAYVTEFPSSYA